MCSVHLIELFLHDVLFAYQLADQIFSPLLSLLGNLCGATLVPLECHKLHPPHANFSATEGYSQITEDF